MAFHLKEIATVSTSIFHVSFLDMNFNLWHTKLKSKTDQNT